MLSRLKKRVEEAVGGLGVRLGKAGVKPNHLTLAGLAFSVASFYSSLIDSILLYSISLILSGLFDMLDGAVARATGSSTRLGAFLDSFSDRISDSLIILALINFGFSWWTISILLVSSLLISYTRARAESLGVNLEGVGLIERSERLILLITISFLLPFSSIIAQALIWVLIVLSIETIVHRLYYTIKVLGGSNV
ncbi:archaetidylinositol phosphate synthase [Thermogladius sp. 4427co]|uniref:archaetidylinositol phosphate synthase n=1 Tax=Thermogladius sp. 4427co TaxID=3450718 RepID=UPI003F7ADBC8